MLDEAVSLFFCNLCIALQTVISSLSRSTSVGLFKFLPMLSSRRAADSRVDSNWQIIISSVAIHLQLLLLSTERYGARFAGSVLRRWAYNVLWFKKQPEYDTDRSVKKRYPVQAYGKLRAWPECEALEISYSRQPLTDIYSKMKWVAIALSAGVRIAPPDTTNWFGEGNTTRPA